MARSYTNAVRRSLFAKLAVWLVDAARSRDMSAYPSLQMTEDGRYTYTDERDYDYSVMPKLATEPLDTPGVNVVWLEAVDISSRMRRKRYVASAVIVITRPLEGASVAVAVDNEVRSTAAEVEACLRDGVLEVWDYEQVTPLDTGGRAYWHDSEMTWMDESAAVPGGDIRLTMELALEFIERDLL